MTDTRKTFLISGSDANGFLQGLITNDLKKLDRGLVYAALLTPQGKYIADFFLSQCGDAILLDVHDNLADDLEKRLGMYRLRADVQISEAGLFVHRGTGDIPEDGLVDPRNSSMGWRAYRSSAQQDNTDWNALHVAHVVPETGIELSPETYILEVGFERLNGVDFRKGCYVGQEVTARMKHKTELRKGLVQVDIEGTAPIGSEITAGGKSVGTLYSQADGKALAYLRFDRAKGNMIAGDATVTWVP